MPSIYILHEEYRAIPNHLNLWASSSGKIASTNKYRGSTSPRILTPYADKDGYMRTTAIRGGKPYTACVHQLVLFAWLGSKPENGESRHLDGNKENNSIDNLIWGTQRENGGDRAKHGSSKGEKNHRSKMDEATVIKLRAEFKDKTLTVITRENPEFSQFAIWAAITGYTWSHVPGAAKTNRKCTKNGWREGVKLR